MHILINTFGSQPDVIMIWHQLEIFTHNTRLMPDIITRSGTNTKYLLNYATLQPNHTMIWNKQKNLLSHVGSPSNFNMI